MTQFLNNMINKVFIGLKYLAYVVVVALWLVLYPINRIIPTLSY